MEKIRLAMVGYGFRGAGLLGMAHCVQEFELTAVCDINAEIEKKVKTDFPEVKFFNDYKKMIGSGEIDAVLIEAPPKMHAACAIIALEKDIHVLSDVPVLDSLSEVEPLWNAACQSKAVYMFGSTANYFGFVETCNDLIEKSLLGKPFYLEAEYIHDITEFAKITPWRRGYEPIRYCTHSLAPLLEWIDDELVSISCFDTGSHVHKGENNHDAMVAICKTASNVVIKLLVSFTNSNTHGMHRYLCHGTKGIFECTWPLSDKPKASFSTKQIYGLDKAVELQVSSDRPEHANLTNLSGHGSLDYSMLVDFAKAINGKTCKIDLKQGLKMTLPGLFALESARSGGKLVKIKYPWQ